ncbi:MAG: hypothetical protein F9K43_01485 [Bauldia sp.]|nr:MAG: hypothetical protein F9K43_01485 [Bauldia sp.]
MPAISIAAGNGSTIPAIEVDSPLGVRPMVERLIEDRDFFRSARGQPGCSTRHQRDLGLREQHRFVAR